MFKNKNLQKILKLIKKSDKIVFFHHVLPDGDSLSCSYGLMKAIQQKFPNKTIKWVADKKTIKENFSYIINDFSDAIDSIDKTWTAVIGDSSILKRIYKHEEFIKAGQKICFDHHQNDVNFDVDVFMKDSDLGASSIQAYMIAKKLKVKFNDEIAILLLFGILTDTFNFMYTLNDIRPLEVAKSLLLHIKRETIDNLYKNLRKRTKKDLEFQKFVLNNLKIEKNVSYFKLKEEDIKKLKLSLANFKKINIIGNIENVEVWIFLREDKKEKMIHVSLRSNGCDVNKIAQKFGGGGHQRAAGIKLKLDWKLANKVIKEVQNTVSKYIKNSGK